MIKPLIKNAHWLFLALGILVFFASLFNGFVWDDEEQILANQTIHSLSSLPSIWTGSTFNSAGAANMSGMYYKPLMMTTFALTYSISNDSAWVFHLFQLLIHITSAYLLYRVFAHMLSSPPLSLFSALIFLVHPLVVETVVYISALQDTLAFFFFILALFLTTRRPTRFSILWVLILCLCSLFSKETGILSFLIIGIFYSLFQVKNLTQYLLG